MAGYPKRCPAAAQLSAQSSALPAHPKDTNNTLTLGGWAVKIIRRLLVRKPSQEAGFSLIEVIIAMMVFMIIATAVAYTMTSALKVTKESRSRVEAANLASQEIDLDRSTANVFNLLDTTRSVSVNGQSFTIKRTTQWVSDPNVAQSCGTGGGGSLRYKRINVSVTWAGMTNTAAAVRSDTLLEPGVHLNDPTKGTILVSVADQSGAGIAGVSVSAAPSLIPNGAVAPPTPAVTDSQGCTYLLSVEPGNYDITVSKSPYLDGDQDTTPTQTRPVVAGSSASTIFTIDQQATINLAYAPNYTATAPMIATNANVSFVASTETTVSIGPVTSMNLFPYSGGYQVYAGNIGASTPYCNSVDPGQWPAGASIMGPAMPAGSRQLAASTSPGGSASGVPVVMGIATITSLTAGQFLTAEQQTSAVSGSSDPGCAFPSTYQFGATVGTSATIALPFGRWKLYTGTSAGAKTSQVSNSRMTAVTTPLGAGGTNSSNGGTLVLDPRHP